MRDIDAILVRGFSRFHECGEKFVRRNATPLQLEGSPFSLKYTLNSNKQSMLSVCKTTPPFCKTKRNMPPFDRCVFFYNRQPGSRSLLFSRSMLKCARLQAETKDFSE